MHEVIVRAQDEKEKMSEWSEPHNVSITVYSNSAPLTPDSPQGPATGFTNQSISFKAATTDPDNDSIKYVFDFGDENLMEYEYIPSGDTASLNHTYSEDGNFEVRVQAEDRNGASSEWSEPHSISISFNYPDSVVNVISTTVSLPSKIAVLPSGEYIYVACRGSGNSGQVEVYNTETHTMVQAIPLPYAAGVTSLPNGEFLYVTSSGRDAVYVIRTSDNTIVDTIPNLSFPYSAVSVPNGQYVYVLAENRIYVIRTSDNALIDSVITVNWPIDQSIEVLPNGEYVYAGNGMNSLLAIRTSDMAATAIPINGSPYGIAALPDNQYVYVGSNSNIYVIQTSDHSICDSIETGGGYSLITHPSGKFIYATLYDDPRVLIINTVDRTVIDSVHAGYQSTWLAADSDGETVYVSSEYASEVYVIGK